MKKIVLLTAISFNLFIGFGQEHYSFPTGTKFQDMPGDHFLAYRFETDKTILQEINLSGAIVWEDTIPFLSGNTGIAFNSLTPFKGTDDFLLIMTKNLTNFTTQDNEIIYQYSRFSIDNQSPIHFIDTLTLIGTETLSMNDTSIYLFNYYNTIPVSGSRDIETYKINRDLDLFFVAPKDSIYFYPFGGGIGPIFYEAKDTLYRLFSNDAGDISNEVYSLNITNLGTNDYTLPFSNEYCEYEYREPVSEDSILVVSKVEFNISHTYKWFFGWLNNDLTEINSKIINLSSINLHPPFDMMYAVVSNSRIYFLADSMDYNGFDVARYLFVYDFNFNLVCKTEVSEISYLNEINEAPYLAYLSGSTIEYNLIDNCQLLSIEDKQSNDLFFSVYPNPVNEYLLIENPFYKQVKIILKDFEGRLLNQYETFEKNISFEMTDFSNGIYFIEVSNGDETQIKKIVKN